MLDALPFSNRVDRPQLPGTPGSLSGMDLDVVDVTVASGAKSATVRVNTSGDKFWLGGFITSITTQAPDFTDTIKEVKRVFKPDGTLRTDGTARLDDTPDERELTPLSNQHRRRRLACRSPICA